MHENLLRPEQAAALLCVSTATIRRWDNSGLISTVRTPGRQRRIPLAEVKRILAENVSAVEGDFPPDRETLQSFVGKDKKASKSEESSENMLMLANLFKDMDNDRE